MYRRRPTTCSRWWRWCRCSCWHTTSRCCAAATSTARGISRKASRWSDFAARGLAARSPQGVRPMHVCVFEDQGVHNLEPLSLTRAAFDLRCGALTLLERQVRTFAADEVGALVRPPL